MLGPVGRGRGAGVVVNAHPAPRAGVTVEDKKTSSRCWGCNSIAKCRKGEQKSGKIRTEQVRVGVQFL